MTDRQQPAERKRRPFQVIIFKRYNSASFGKDHLRKRSSSVVSLQASSLTNMLVLLYYLLFLVSSGTHPVKAWGSVGHKVVGEIAWNRLSPRTQLAVEAILFSSPCYPNTNNSSSTLLTSPLAQIATWADDMRYTEAYKWTTPLHYIDVNEKSYKDQCLAFSKDCQFVYERDCVDDFCVAGAITNYTQKIPTANSQKRDDTTSPLPLHLRTTRRQEQLQQQQTSSCNEDAEALMFVTHFVGDIHQPLHVSRKGDVGGNTIHVYFPTKMLQKASAELHGRFIFTNLHKVWDDDIIDRATKESCQDGNSQVCFFEVIQEFMRNHAAEIDSWLLCATESDSTSCTSAWAKESLHFALTVAYADVNTRQDIETKSVLPEEYYDLGFMVVKKRLAQAGVRLAYILETVLGSK